MKDLINNLKPHKKEGLIWLSSIVLMTIWVYQGSAHYYLNLDFLPQSFDQHVLAWDKYTYHHLATFVLFFLCPALIVKFVLKEHLRDYGVQLGDWKWGLKITLVAVLIVTPAIYLSSFDEAFLREYPLTMLSMWSMELFLAWSAIYILYYIGWEFLFRGFLLHGLKQMGYIHSLMAQTAISTIIHIGKPQGEMIGAIIGGLFMGWLAHRSKSLLWPFIFHLLVGIMNSYFCGLNRLME